MIVEPTAPDLTTQCLLNGATFADAYRVVVDESGLDEVTAARRILGRTPPWISQLMRLRNVMVAPLGLKPAPDDALPPDRAIGSFPLISQEPGRVVLGLDDSHLDFRIAVDVSAVNAAQTQITATTLVRPHNLLGRAYLAIVLPFHRLIVPAMLAKAGTSA